MVVVVTGATSGVGLGAARGLARRGARVVMVGRASERADRVADALTALGADGVDRVGCDLGRAGSVDAAAAELAARYPRIDALISCAGVLPWRRETVDGVERVWATNVLGPIRLVEALVDRCARVVTITGDLHRYGAIAWDDPELARGYSALRAGTQSALAKLMWTLELARRVGGGAAVNAFCPGFVDSGLTDGFPWWARPATAAARWFAATPDEGARTAVWLAADAPATTGGYYRFERPVAPSAAAADPAAQARLVARVRGAWRRPTEPLR